MVRSMRKLRLQNSYNASRSQRSIGYGQRVEAKPCQKKWCIILEILSCLFPNTCNLKTQNCPNSCYACEHTRFVNHIKSCQSHKPSLQLRGTSSPRSYSCQYPSSPPGTVKPVGGAIYVSYPAPLPPLEDTLVLGLASPLLIPIVIPPSPSPSRDRSAKLPTLPSPLAAPIPNPPPPLNPNP